MAVIRVPKTPMSAYNTKRRASDLLRSQIQHLKWAIADPPQRTAKLKPPMVKGRLTEGQAAEQITKLSRRLQKMAKKRYEASNAGLDAASNAGSNAAAKSAAKVASKKTLKASKKRASKTTTAKRVSKGKTKAAR